MKISELINEVSVFRHNSVKVMRVEDALKKLFPEDTPKLMNSSDGMYVVLDKIQVWEYDDKRLGEFILRYDKTMDDYHQIKKFFVDYIPTIEEPTPTEEETKKEA